MRKEIFVLVLLFCVVWVLAGAEDNPRKGNWNFQPECVWSAVDFNGEFWGKPLSILILSNGNVAVYDTRLDKNILLDPKGTFLTVFGAKGEGPREVKRQSFWFATDEMVIIPDMGAVHYFNEQGTWVESRKVSPMPPPRGFLDKNHMIMVPRTVFEIGGGKGYFSVVDLNDDAKSLDLFEISDLFKGGFAQVGEDVMDVLVPGLSPMVEVGISQDFIVYGSSSQYNLIIVDPQGRKTGSFGIDRKKTPVSHARIAEHLKTMGLPEDKIMPLAKSFPEELVCFEDIQIVGNRIWVQQPRLDRHYDTLTYDIFSTEGVYLYRADMHLPEGEFLKSPFKNHFIRGDRMVAVVEKEDGSLNVACYRIRIPE